MYSPLKMTSQSATNLNHSNNGTGNDAILVTSGPIFNEFNDEQFEIYIYPLVFTLIYMIVGFIGNFVVIYIFTCQWKLTKTTVFILTLAIVDIFSCMFNMPIEAVMLWQPLDFDHDKLCKISRYTTFFASAGSSFVLVAIAIDRYLMVCRPFKSRELGVPYAKKSCIVAVLLGIALTWPSLIFYGTYKYYLFRNEGDSVYKIESKICLITNYYTENYTLPGAFYFFLLGGHSLICIILTTVYVIIGRHLFMATNTDVPSEKRHSLKFFGMSMVSAITGNIPKTPDTASEAGGHRSKPPSSENLHNYKMDHSPPPNVENGNYHVGGSGQNSPYRRGTPYPGHKIYQNITVEVEGENMQITNHANGCTGQNRLEATHYSDISRTPSPRLKGKHLRLNVDGHVESRSSEFLRESPRISSESVGNDKRLQPMSPKSPETVRGILYRSQSEGDGSKSNINKVIADELRNSAVKEFSLKRNTLIMRVVTMAFIVSFLPYLIIVTIRSSNPDIPHKLDKAAQIAYHVFLRGYFINSMINPFIYGFLNEEFRQKLKSLFCKLCASKFSL